MEVVTEPHAFGGDVGGNRKNIEKRMGGYIGQPSFQWQINLDPPLLN